MPGRGYPRLAETEQGFDPARGQSVYAAKCALCHGEDGSGVVSAQPGTLFPSLRGAGSYNWRADGALLGELPATAPSESGH